MYSFQSFMLLYFRLVRAIFEYNSGGVRGFQYTPL